MGLLLRAPGGLVLRINLNLAAQESAGLLYREMDFEDDGCAGSQNAQHLQLWRRAHYCK